MHSTEYSSCEDFNVQCVDGCLHVLSSSVGCSARSDKEHLIARYNGPCNTANARGTVISKPARCFLIPGNVSSGSSRSMDDCQTSNLAAKRADHTAYYRSHLIRWVGLIPSDKNSLSRLAAIIIYEKHLSGFVTSSNSSPSTSPPQRRHPTPGSWLWPCSGQPDGACPVGSKVSPCPPFGDSFLSL